MLKSNNDDKGYEYVTLKVKSGCFKLYRAYSISFPIRQMFVNFFWSSILIDCIEVQEKKEEVLVLRSRPLQNVKIGVMS